MSGTQSPVLAEIRHRIGYLTLNRPEGLNALNLDMVRLLRAQLDLWLSDEDVRVVVLRASGDRAFSVGGDVRALYHSYLAGDKAAAETFFTEEYALDQLIHRYPKPVVALLDGYVLGGGMGLAQGALTIATQRSRLGMPETGIGFFPDVGASYFLSRLPGALGIYLGVTGTQLSAADARYAGLLDIVVDDDGLGAVEKALAGFNGSDQVFSMFEAQLHEMGLQPGYALQPLRPAIDRHFSAGDLRSIRDSLGKEQNPAWRDWAQQTLALMETRSPLAMAVTLELLRRGRQLHLEGCFALELYLDRQWFEHGDIAEGVRALLVDKDRQPRWRVPSIDLLEPGMVADFFEGFAP
ncbi:enoyl-CoA hydratase/isomerase family protein [Halopseudomonas nanhaiensis]|uniref:enoyl-CoA hydratase/isomerase family protein n=1 Tax=Halopseudomonas nanhaiensis TaxID=2830842 RepID=UPI001CC049E0|nr:enoyl-CoA hydratase/isomerase family protein [Halopseudomonas nanhaiensis]UAW97655.1 enoyl-CoA hydratase/isomerase family protein [Halopseudomonas nanhaiensis]